MIIGVRCMLRNPYFMKNFKLKNLEHFVGLQYTKLYVQDNRYISQ